MNHDSGYQFTTGNGIVLPLIVKGNITIMNDKSDLKVHFKSTQGDKEYTEIVKDVNVKRKIVWTSEDVRRF